MLSGYRLMWILVMFDLPVVEDDERRAANRFRLTLLDLGFQRCQFSVYTRFCTSSAQLGTYCKQVEAALPGGGRVDILQFTDKQYERIITYRARVMQPPEKAPDQFHLF
jgi:CRISPR-associated protein Cas2